jgi:hypothetical protein
MVLFVVLVLIHTLVGNFDNSVDDLWAFGACGEFKVIRHVLGFSSLVKYSGISG